MSAAAGVVPAARIAGLEPALAAPQAPNIGWSTGIFR